MKLSEYISRLQKVNAEHGDLDVVIVDASVSSEPFVLHVKEAGVPEIVDLLRPNGLDFFAVWRPGKTVRDDQRTRVESVGTALRIA